MVVDRPLIEAEWNMVRAFARCMEREDIRLRFGHAVDLDDEATLRRFFDVKGGLGEIAWLLDEAGTITGITHRVIVSPTEAEAGLVVRSDLKRIGIGEFLLRQLLARSAQQDFKTLSASVLRENRAMLLLAAKIGYQVREASGLLVELVFDLNAAATAA
jgi:acetyltransferase